MGAWGSGILQDDTTADIVGFMKDRLKAGSTLMAASAAARSHFGETQRDEDEAPLLWLALAEVQWKYGAVEPAVLARVRADIDGGAGLERWRDDAKALKARQSALAKFVAKIASANPKPSALPRIIVRKAPFEAGDCLSVLLPDGRFTAALVLRADDSNPEYGRNLVVGLDYLDTVPPELAAFERRQWLTLSHGRWNGKMDMRWCLPVKFRAMARRLERIGSIKLRRGDPTECSISSAWTNVGVQILLERAHRAESAVVGTSEKGGLAGLVAKLRRR